MPISSPRTRRRRLRPCRLTRRRRPASDNVSSLVQNLGAPSIDELEKIIGELQQARTYLKSESERIERETVGYTELSQTAMESVRIIAETVGEWRKAGHPVRSTHGA